MTSRSRSAAPHLVEEGLPLAPTGAPPTRPRLRGQLQRVREQRPGQRLRAVDALLQQVLAAEGQAVGEELVARRASSPSWRTSVGGHDRVGLEERAQHGVRGERPDVLEQLLDRRRDPAATRCSHSGSWNASSAATVARNSSRGSKKNSNLSRSRSGEDRVPERRQRVVAVVGDDPGEGGLRPARRAGRSG